MKPVGSDRVIQAGTFAALSGDYNKAMLNAETTIQRWVQHPFDVDVEIKLYKPDWLYKISGGRFKP